RARRGVRRRGLDEIKLRLSLLRLTLPPAGSGGTSRLAGGRGGRGGRRPAAGLGHRGALGAGERDRRGSVRFDGWSGLGVEGGGRRPSLLLPPRHFQTQPLLAARLAL